MKILAISGKHGGNWLARWRRKGAGFMAGRTMLPADTGDHPDGETLPGAGTLTLFLIIATFWLATHPFTGIGGDGLLYAAQAVSRLYPEMRSHDLFFAFGSQDDYSIFGAIYAWAITHLGLHDATRALLYTAYCAWLAAGMLLVRQVLSGLPFWLAVALIVLLPGDYGSGYAFSYAERWLTARTWAEPFALLSVALALGGRKIAASAAILAACALHPIMAFPAALLVGFLLLPARVSAAMTVAGLAAALALTLLDPPFLAGFTRMMDDPWLSLVRSGSPFMFITEWQPREYAKPLLFATLFLAARILAGAAPAGRLWSAALAAQALCIGLALLSCYWPLAILVQMQSWRVMWIANVLGIACAIWLFSRLWQSNQMSRWLLAGLAASWLTSDTPGMLAALLLAGLFAWSRSGRHNLPLRAKTVVNWAVGLYVAITLAGLIQSVPRSLAVIGILSAGCEPGEIIGCWSGILRQCALPLLLLGIVIGWYASKHFLFRPIAMSVAVGVAAGALLTFDHTRGELVFQDTPYKAAPPPPENIATLLGRNSVVYMEDGVAYVWFALHLPHYASRIQMTGMAFSRETALESKRRHAMLAPLNTQDVYLGWKDNKHTRKKIPARGDALPLACRDPLLDFILLAGKQPYPEVASFHPFGPEGRLYLVYDCRQLRQDSFLFKGKGGMG